MRHTLIITGTTTGGEFLIPYIVTLQDSFAIRKRRMSQGVRLGVDFVLRQRSKPYVSRKLFLEYITTIFVPYPALAKNRKVDHRPHQKADLYQFHS
jgi:hypothetical protein